MNKTVLKLLLVSFLFLNVGLVAALDCGSYYVVDVDKFEGSGTLKVVYSGVGLSVYTPSGVLVNSWSDSSAVYFPNLNITSYVLGVGCSNAGSDENVFYRFGFQGWHPENGRDTCIIDGNGVLTENSVTGNPCVSLELNLQDSQLRMLFVEAKVKPGVKDVGFGTRRFNSDDALWRTQAYVDVRDQVNACSFLKSGSFNCFAVLPTGWNKVTLYADHTNSDASVYYWINDVKQPYVGVLLNANNQGSGVLRVDCNSESSCQARDVNAFIMNPLFSFSLRSVSSPFSSQEDDDGGVVDSAGGNCSVFDLSSLIFSISDDFFRSHTCMLRNDVGCLVSFNSTCNAFYGVMNTSGFKKALLLC